MMLKLYNYFQFLYHRSVLINLLIHIYTYYSKYLSLYLIDIRLQLINIGSKVFYVSEHLVLLLIPVDGILEFAEALPVAIEVDDGPLQCLEYGLVASLEDLLLPLLRDIDGLLQ
jgi:hypothetical protein